MTRSIKLASYLFTRLKQQGVHALHGVPGDYTLKALDQVKPSGLRWVGNVNELNASYAADGYARIRGLGAVYTTYGVGELSAINAIAASYAEYVPVVHIVGAPPTHLKKTRKQRRHLQVHHSLGDGRFRVFAEIQAKVTAAQAELVDAEQAPELIDRTIEHCLRTSRPVYIEMPSDMVNVDVSAERLSTNISIEPTCNEREHDWHAEQLLQRIYNAKQPLILVDRAFGASQLKTEINELVKRSGIATLTLPSGNSMVDHSLPNYFGVHAGEVGQIDTMPFVRHCDLVLAFGPMFSDTQTLGWSVVPDPEKTIFLGSDSKFGDIADIQIIMQKMLRRLEPQKISHSDTTSLGNFRTITATPADPTTPVDQTSFYLRLNPFFRPDDIILLGNATPVLGGRDFILPPRARVIASCIAFSIGHMLPAAQGAALAQEQEPGKGRTILFMGDGGFQVTAQELSTIIWQRLNAIIFVINNAGYAYERHIHGLDAPYNDVAPWNYLEAPRLFGQPEGYRIDTYRVKTWKDLDELLGNEGFGDGQGLKIVDVVMDKYDVPEKFRTVFQNAGKHL